VRKGSTTAPLIILAFLTGLGGVGFILGIPSTGVDTVERGVSEGAGATKAKALTTYFTDDYFEEAIKYTVYNASIGLAMEGGGVEIWRPGELPTEDEVTDNLLQEMADHLEGYIGSDTHSSVEEDGTLELPDLDWEIEEPRATVQAERTDELLEPEDSRRQMSSLRYSVSSSEPGRVEFATEHSVARSAFPVGDANISKGNRFFYLYDVAIAVSEEDEWRDRIADVVENSSKFIVAEEAEEFVGECDGDVGFDSCSEVQNRQPAVPTFSDVEEDATNEQEEEMQIPLNDSLNFYLQEKFVPEIPDMFDDRYEEINVTANVIGIEYDVPDGEYEKISGDDQLAESGDGSADYAGYRVSSCDYSCGENIEDKDCDSCGCSVTCDAEPDCPDSTVCHTTSFSEPSGGGETITTDDPWKLSPPESHGEPFGRIAYHTSIPADRWIAAEAPDREHPSYGYVAGRGGTEECDGDSCYDREATKNDVSQQSRGVWEMNKLDATVQVEVFVKDKRNQIPSPAGETNMTFRFVYEQEQTMNFAEDGDGGTVDYPGS